MKAGDLAIILAHVDPDMEVHIRGRSGCTHVNSVIRTTRRHTQPGSYDREVIGSIQERSIILEGKTRWFDPAPPFTLDGPFRQRVHLDEQLGRR